LKSENGEKSEKSIHILYFVKNIEARTQNSEYYSCSGSIHRAR